MPNVIHVNLVPQHRRLAKAQQSRLRLWMGIGSGFAIVLIVLLGLAHLLWGSEIRPLQSEMLVTANEIAKTEASTEEIRADLAEAQRTLEARRTLDDQPDWSILFAVLSLQVGEEVVLDLCHLDQAIEEPPKPAAPPIGAAALVQAVATPIKPVGPVPPALLRTSLRIGGVGKSQMSVSKFVLRLEKTDLFERVSLVHTNQVQFLGSDAVGFRLECTMRGRRKAVQ